MNNTEEIIFSLYIKFHAVLGKIWQNCVPPGGFTPPLGANPESANAPYIRH